MAEQITQDITLPDEPPSSRDRVNFRPRADIFVAWMKTFATQIASLIPKINTALTWINTNVQNALTYSETATTQAGIATTKAGEASASAASALLSKEAAEAALDAFDDKYLGAKDTFPTIDNDGNPLQMGATFWKITSPKAFYVYDSELSAWQQLSFVPTAHSSLSGRANADAHPMDAITGLNQMLADKQALLVSGTNIKTINNINPLGSGNIDITTPDATDTTKGKVELATNAEVQAGTDTGRAITPAGLLSAFSNSKAANGYCKLPNGLIIQWFNATGGSGTYNFPIAFPTACLEVIMSNGYSSINAFSQVTSFTTTGATTYCNASVLMRFIAIGH